MHRCAEVVRFANLLVASLLNMHFKEESFSNHGTTLMYTPLAFCPYVVGWAANYHISLAPFNRFVHLIRGFTLPLQFNPPHISFLTHSAYDQTSHE